MRADANVMVVGSEWLYIIEGRTHFTQCDGSLLQWVSGLTAVCMDHFTLGA
jgi:hypothetical protein